MRKRNSINRLNRTTSHREAMLRNMATSLFEHERIITTRAKGKVLRTYAEKLITRAKKNLGDGVAPASVLHNKREVMKVISNRTIVTKLFEELAPRYKERAGGYTRIIHLPERRSDSAEMSIIELVDRKEKIRTSKLEKGAAQSKKKTSKKKTTKKGEAEEKAAPETTKKAADKDQKKPKWWHGFKKKKGEEYDG